MTTPRRSFLVSVRDEHGDLITFCADRVDFEHSADPWVPFIIEIEGARDFG